MLLMGDTRSGKYLRRAKAHGWGRLFATGKLSPKEGESYAIDNGVFPAWKDDVPWHPQAFMKLLGESRELPRPELVVLPDIVGGGTASVDRSRRWLDVLDEVHPGYPWFLAVQDGMRPGDIAPLMPRLGGLFLGGTDHFKGTAPEWSSFAHAHGKRFHYARVSTENRLRAAFDCGADSADSAQMLWSDEHFARFEGWWNHLSRQESLFARTA